MSDNMHRPELIIIAGPNGSGKTSVTQKFLHHEWAEGTIYINPDEVAKDKFGDWNSREAIISAANFCAQWREECLEQKKSFVFETVMSAESGPRRQDSLSGYSLSRPLIHQSLLQELPDE